MPYRLEQGEALGEGLVRVAAEQAGAAVGHLQHARKDPATAVHEARKRSKEARAAVRLLRAEVGAEPARVARAALRDAARQVAELRDAEVAIQTLERLRKEGRLLRRDRIPAEAALRARRDAALRRLTRRSVASLVEAFTAAGAALPAPTGAAGAAGLARELTRIYGRGRRAMRRAWRTGEDEAFHLWRHEAKDLWYAMRLLAGAWPRPLDALAAELREVSNVLGEEHDLTVLAAALGGGDRGEPSLLTPRLERAIARRRNKLRGRARPLGERLWAEPAPAFGKRLARYWACWADGGAAKPAAG